VSVPVAISGWGGEIGGGKREGKGQMGWRNLVSDPNFRDLIGLIESFQGCVGTQCHIARSLDYKVSDRFN
jgi:hypothetical protein